jgi:Protein of unknown function (DUF1588)/Protein of unknown function (DUF1592)/Protein of unknown function (DUF1585)/Protein of unknown function (DUF1587)/Protein of unknown function (DUF1595)/Planctomycete cytochrome C
LLIWLCWAAAAAPGHSDPGATAADTAVARQFRREIEPVLGQYCFDCHADGANKGGVALDQFQSGTGLLEKRELWWDVLKYLRAGLMPPAGKPRPTETEKLRLANWIKYSVFGIDPRHLDPGRVTIRRLNRVEYRNSIRDLLDIDFNAEVEFPPDDTGYGFDDIGDVLTLSPMLLEKYISAARSIVGEAVPVVSRSVPEFTLAGSRFRLDGGNGGEGQRRRDAMLSLPFDQEATVAARFESAHSGDYHLKLELAVKGAFDFDPRKCRVVLKLDDQALLEKEFGWYENKVFPLEFERKLEASGHRLKLELQPLATGTEGTNTLSLRIVSFTVRGPMEQQFWSRPKNYERFFPRDVPAAAAERRAYAQEILQSFASKAFRRPVDGATVERLTGLAEGAYTEPGKTFEAGMAHAFEAVLCSPRFLFRLEESAAGRSAAPWSPVDEYSLASRLSYFLWSTTPDDELLRLAAQGELRKNLAAQVNRLLADPRVEALVQNFTGQWLQLRDLDGLVIDARVVFARDRGQEKELREVRAAFLARIAEREAQARAAQAAKTNGLAAVSTQTNAPAQAGQRKFFGGFRSFGRPPFELDRDLRRAMKSETEMFFAGIVREDRSVLELLESDYTYLNEKLATVYGLTNLQVSGSELHRVALPADSARGGILTQGSILAVTSNPDRTSPVKRGLFVLNNLLGMPAPPPPPNVPALEASEKDFKDQQPTLRAALELHRSQPLCSSCHSRMDPIGLGLENFNALGVWREKERGQEIETAGRLVTGESFNNVRELKHILVTGHRREFYRCLTEKLLTYALGRGLEYYDVETVDQIGERLEREQGRFSALLLGIIESVPFQEHRNRANASFTASNEPLNLPSRALGRLSTSEGESAGVRGPIDVPSSKRDPQTKIPQLSSAKTRP